MSDLQILKDENMDYKIKDLAVTGQDIIDKFGFTPGPRVGRVLEKLLELVIVNPKLNNKEKLLDLAKNI